MSWIRLRFVRYKFVRCRFVRYRFRFVRYRYRFLLSKHYLFSKTSSSGNLEEVLKICLNLIFYGLFMYVKFMVEKWQVTLCRLHVVKNFVQNFCNSKLNLPVKLYEKWIKERTLLKKKKNFTVILGYSRMAFAFVLSQFDKSAII